MLVVQDAEATQQLVHAAENASDARCDKHEDSRNGISRPRRRASKVSTQMAFTATQWSGARAVATESPEDGYEGRNRRRTCVEAKGAKKISEEGVEPSISSV
ncbi:hypothetical protein PF002_g8282 [Phytophthora fragariae]|uniref:Uncharacterized protein n=2 Tax=Phytophthora fragariae TaxID=53985 RepID=A0A6A3ZWA3_9STRA|nr:hypothetical protein PF003_g38516 [Phytophthora fragariae]KAG2957793.1 hypothetical protein PC120_g28441 [Phytophthora cactorum]KAE8877435.1 hypothetical protein PF003_g38513 [Phytophthora fragariae]KAE8877448.1 hypothetical protein PF003_g38518 [Phytophthora fragariae]KAE8916212.1 hypothetical protein PF009_g33462 [Phytophthora fragariae]